MSTLIKYVSNLDPYDGTAAIRLQSGTVPLGQEGEATEEELLVLGQSINYEVVGDGLDDENVDDLKQLAKDEDIDLGNAKKKDDIVDAIRQARADRPLGVADESELPATATTGAPNPLGGQGSAAGPEGAGSPPPDTGSAGTTGTP